MGKNLIADGHRVRCWNRTRRDFPDFTPSIQDAVNGAEVIFIIVYDPPAVQSILNQMLSKLGPGQLVIQSSTILHIGPLGSASTLKLAMNLNIAGIAQTLCESLVLCRRAGIPDGIYFSALAPNAAHSGVSDLKGPKLRQHDYSAQFSLKNMAKDLRLALETAADLSLPLEQTGHLKDIYDRGIAAGWSDDDFIGLMRLLDKNARLNSKG